MRHCINNFCSASTKCSVHSSDKLVDQHLPVAMVTTLDEMPGLLAKPSPSAAQLERPEEVVYLLEMRTHSVDLMDQVFHTDYAVLPKSLNKNRDKNVTDRRLLQSRQMNIRTRWE